MSNPDDEICIVDVACSSTSFNPTGDAFLPISTDDDGFLFDSYLYFEHNSMLEYQCGPGRGFQAADDTTELSCGWDGQWVGDSRQCRCKISYCFHNYLYALHDLQLLWVQKQLLALASYQITNLFSIH